MQRRRPSWRRTCTPPPALLCLLLPLGLLLRLGGSEGAAVPVSAVRYRQATGKTTPIFAENETTLFVDSGAPGAITNMFFGGQFDKPGAKTGGVGYRNTVLRVYVDGEPTAAIEATIYNLHGFGADDANTTQGYDLASCTRQYGNSKLGKTAANSGQYNTFRIPFAKGVRVTAQAPASFLGHCDHSCAASPGSPNCCGLYYHIAALRGAALPITLGGDLVELPETARLRTFTNHAPLLQPLEYFPLMNISGRGGAVLYTGMAARDMSGDPKGNWRFLEGCMRLAIDGGELEILSDGTESYFYGSLYFDNGNDDYANDIAGLMQYYGTGHTAGPTGGGSDGGTPPHFSAYRFHDSELLIWHESLKLVWRSGDVNQCLGDGPVLYGASKTEAWSQVLAYTW